MPRLPLRMFGIHAGFQRHGRPITGVSSIFRESYRAQTSTRKQACKASMTQRRSLASRKSTMTNYATFLGSPSNQLPKSNQHRNLQFGLSTTYSQGRHSIKFGANLTHERGGFINGSSSTGVFDFTGIYSGNAFAEFLLGIPDNVTRDYFKTLNGDFGYYMNLYVQDNYRVSERLTLNLGFRLERNTFYQGINGGKTAFDPATQKIVVPSNFNPNAQLLTPRTAPALSPIGLSIRRAWGCRGRFSLRSGTMCHALASRGVRRICLRI